MNDATQRLRELAHRLADVHVTWTRPRAILLAGSAATGDADYYSDLDLILYHDEAVPADEVLAAARAEAGGGELTELAPRTETTYIESYPVHGIECQFEHQTVAGFERDLATVLVELDVESPLQKAIGGLLEGIPLHGRGLIGRWQEEARYPDALRRAMIERYWRFWPIWYIHERLAVRDALLWRHRALVDSAYNLLAVLAGLNRLYFSSFQFKRMRKLVTEMELAPADLADRIESLVSPDGRAAVAELEALVAETQALVAAELPSVDVTLRWPPGVRQTPWG